MNFRSSALLLVLATAALAACGGGGGGSAGGGGGGVTPPGPTPTVTPTLTPTTTTASGKLVDDPSGAPLGGVNVALVPWVVGATPIPEGTTAPDGSFSFTAANGHYLLYIGSNLSTDTTRPTIHDNITLTGGAQTLKGPTLPPIPSITPPPMETNGSYRLMTLDQTAEVPCFNAFNSQRAGLSLAKVVEDEWLTENSREIVAYEETPAFISGGGPVPWPGNRYEVITSGANGSLGGTSCADMIPFAFSDAMLKTYSANAQTLWFGGDYVIAAQADGNMEYPIDPRVFTDPNIPLWP